MYIYLSIYLSICLSIYLSDEPELHDAMSAALARLRG